VALHAATLTDGCLVRNDWLCLEYLQSRGGELASATVQHVYLTVASLLLGIALAFPLAVLTHRSRPAQGFVLGASTAIYTVPSIAMFSLLLPLTGLNASTVIIGLALYSLTILVRNILAGLDAVPADVLDAAKGMGYGSARILLTVQLPLAMPSIFAGLRVAAVSTVALVTVGFLVGYGGLGNLIYEGLTSFFKAQVLTASVLCVLLAVAADALLVATERLATPWRRARS
jgi:osmoprotectant transport system permease protein